MDSMTERIIAGVVLLLVSLALGALFARMGKLLDGIVVVGLHLEKLNGHVASIRQWQAAHDSLDTERANNMEKEFKRNYDEHNKLWAALERFPRP